MKDILNSYLDEEIKKTKNKHIEEDFGKKMFDIGYNKALEEVEKMINKIKLTNPDYSYSNDYINDFLVELKQQIRKLK